LAHIPAPYSINSYGYYSQMSQNLASNIQSFASALIVNGLLAASEDWQV
jgi:hypothetical protein